MARHAFVYLVKNDWVQLTANDVTTISFQNLNNFEIEILGTVDATKPAASEKGYTFEPKTGVEKKALADMFDGMAAVRLWGRAKTAGKIRVDHA